MAKAAEIGGAFLRSRDPEALHAGQPAMLHFQMDEPDVVIVAGVEVDAKRDRCDFGTFAWFTGPEGNRVELWRPK
jgi:predicted enzyme related to lactoylglutathione lyase